MGGRRSAAWVAAALALAATPAYAQDLPSGTDFGGFRNVLPAGEGETVNAQELAAFQANGTRPRSFTSQLPLYTDLLYAEPTLQPADLDRFFKDARFGVPADEIESTDEPRPGVTILRDRTYEVPHVYGATRADTMFGAGYASAQDRLFLMDVLRHTGRANLTELIGPGENNATVKMDAAQLKIADYSEEELQRMIDVAAGSAGAEGAQVKQDLLDYVDGINAYIREARQDISKMPGEYAALGKSPEDWKPTDTVAVASLIGGIFGRGGGGEAKNGLALREAQERFGVGREARRIFNDFRSADDPEAPVTTTRRFPFDDPGRRNGRAIAVPDLHSLEDRNPIVSGAQASASSRSSAAPDWLSRLQQLGIVFPKEQSNALLVAGRKSESGRPVAVMGPQVSYYSPQILMELDLHGPGIDARGAAFPGISLYVLLGRGQDFAWSATTATTDVSDEFAEKLCEPDGSQPTIRSEHYLYKGRCIPFVVRDHVLRHTPGPLDIADGNTETQEFTLRVERSVHGPIQSRATVDGVPVAYAEARSTYFHELESALAFKRLNGNEVSDARSFQRTMRFVNFAFNWFYVDDRDIAYFQSGWYPRRARGVDPSLPAWGTGEWDWQRFDPDTYDKRVMRSSQLPQDINPRRGYLVSWNNKQAPGWRSADDQWSYGSMQRVQRLEKGILAGLRGGGRISLTELVQIMENGATIDPRGQELYPWIRKVIGRQSDPDVKALLGILDEWQRTGSHRRDLDRDGFYDQSAATALMDAWWGPLVQRIFEPVLGAPLVDSIRAINAFDSPPNGDQNGSSYATGWYGYVDKDLRSLLGKRVRDPLSRRYCGRGSLRRCRDLLVGALEDAAREVRQRYGVTDLSQVRVPVTCETGSHACDQIEFTTAGAVNIDPIPWQDRPTFQQIVEVGGHRPR